MSYCITIFPQDLIETILFPVLHEPKFVPWKISHYRLQQTDSALTTKSENHLLTTIFFCQYRLYPLYFLLQMKNISTICSTSYFTLIKTNLEK